ncbi:ABC transporter substrate-binding protein [Bradyrhizobium canariense]|uniref:ABC transporter substrate-binding protein n=1 Tax=Bradyrhizobium canariense TaxID=255045 RepID=UPI001C932100|nr:ABC transporter substrate-binding protein [Bradyrhizobium canariense]MBW5438481.1 ABC transporter substrate-binding protein [Bradyrhizobium canariense]
MAISRRDLMRVGLAAGASVPFPSILRAQAAPSDVRTLRMVMVSELRVYDPIYSSTGATGNHGLAIYDSLFGYDSNFRPQPQMVSKWGVSDDKKIYTFELRDGLGWHDGTPVTAADCVASIRRWAQVDSAGRLMMSRVKDISKKDDKTFTITLQEPFGILINVLSRSGTYLAMMREKDASRPATEQVTSNVGSGPFRFNEALTKPGASVTYDRNDKYIPRSEPVDGLAGGKVVKVDRVVWNNIPDEQTAFGALQANEVDFLQTVSLDLLPAINGDPNIVAQVLDKTGNIVYLRMNCLQKPFNNVKARQAMLHLIDQEAFMRTVVPDPKYWSTVTSLFGNGMPWSNDENTGWFKKGGDPEKAKLLFKEAGYSGEKVIILDPANIPIIHNAAQLLAATLRKIGINAELAPSDWGGLVARRAKKDPVEDGGWSIFMTWDSGISTNNPVGTIAMAANGDKAWFGWPKNDDYEALRAKWADVDSAEEHMALARKMQTLWWDFAGCVQLGQFFSPSVHRKTVTGFIQTPWYVPMWNVQKA